MLIAIDIGNTNITIGLFRESELVSTWRFSTDSQKTSDEYGLLLKQVMSSNNIEVAQIDAAAICSVVPPLTPTFESLLKAYVDVNPLTVVSGTKTGIKILYDSPRDVGSDRIVDAAAAHHIYGGPCIIVDLGTATVFDAINERAEYLGGAIAPGMIVSADSLYRATSQLRRVELNAPDQAIGRNTTHAIQSGAFSSTIWPRFWLFRTYKRYDIQIQKRNRWRGNCNCNRGSSKHRKRPSR